MNYSTIVTYEFNISVTSKLDNNDIVQGHIFNTFLDKNLATVKQLKTLSVKLYFS